MSASHVADGETKLPPTSYAILGLLSFEDEMSGYDLRKYADSSIAWFYWSPAPSQIYAELRRLRRLGMIAEREVPQGRLRGKRVYQLTDAGRHELREWISRSDEHVVVKHTTMLRVWAGHVAGPGALDELLDRHEQWCRERLDHLRRMRDAAAKNETFRYPALVARWGVRHYEAELANLEAVRADLAALRAEEA